MNYAKMNYVDKSKEELIVELQELQQKHNSLVGLYESFLDKQKQTAAELIDAHNEAYFQTEEKAKRAAELIIANLELEFQTEEKAQRAAELIIANIELAFQNQEKAKRAAELIIANKELVLQSEEKEKRATELGIIKGRDEEYAAINEELLQNNDELLIAKLRAEENDVLKTAFLQNMSHEIRTPMNAIMGFSNLLTENFNNKTKLKKFSQIIHQRCIDLLDIINDILDIAKIESGQLPVNKEECKLNELFEDLRLFFTEYQQRIGKQQIKFSFHAFCDPIEQIIVTDKVKLKQIFINLIGNAFKFTNEGAIEAGCKIDNNYLVFYVSDTGIGIPVDKQKTVFERFTQLRQNSGNTIGGTGLGLAIVKGLVSLLGGEIVLKSEPGKGSTFTFTIPYITKQPLHQVPPVIEKSEEFDFPNKTILIVEDDFYNAEYLTEILTDKGLNILHANCGNDAVEISLSQKVDIVLMDVRLPDIDGYEATHQIRQHKPNLKIIAQTAYASFDEKQKAITAGCNDYISKPTNHNVLLSMIKKQLSTP